MNIVIFNSHLLPPSQTFIRDPAEKLEKFTPYYVGSRRVPGLELPEDRTFVINRGGVVGKCREQFFKVSGIAPRLYRQVQQLKPALIHAQFGLSGALVLPWVRKMNIPLIVHYRGADATVTDCTSLNHWIYLRRRSVLQKEASLFLTVSKFIKAKLLEQGFPANKVIHHYHGVDVQKFSADKLVKREPIVLFVGRLTEKKGITYLIHAMAQVQAIKPEAQLIIIGDGPLRTELETIANRLLTRYIFLGVQTPDAVKHWMNRAMVLAAPSITATNGDSEGLPNVVLEAQSMGLPVVSTRHAGIPEAVIHEKTGFLTEEKDSALLAQYSLMLLTHTQMWRQMNEQGRKHVETNFNRDRQTRQLEKHYESVLASR